MKVAKANGSDGAVIDRFLDFVADDIEQRPEAIKALPPDLASRIAALTNGIDAELDAPIIGDVSL